MSDALAEPDDSFKLGGADGCDSMNKAYKILGVILLYFVFLIPLRYITVTLGVANRYFNYDSITFWVLIGLAAWVATLFKKK